MLNENGGSRTDTLIKLVLVFFLSLLSFSVGTFVGKQFSDSQHRVADLEGDTDRVVASIPPDVAKAEPNQAISEEEISKLSDEFVKKERDVASAPAASPAAASAPDTAPSKTAAVAKPAAVHDEIAEVSKKIAQGMKVEPPKAPVSRMPTNYPKDQLASAIGKYTVQLSSHATEDEAKARAKEYRDKGFSAFYVPAKIKDKTWYRVSVGQFTTSEEAKKYKSSLGKDSIFASAIVQKSPSNLLNWLDPRLSKLISKLAMQTRTVTKPWGYELIYAVTDKYVGKVLHVNKGESLSLQFHHKKDETIHIQKGRIKFQTAASPETPLTETILEVGMSYHITPLLVHRMEALEDTDILEVSTPELDDVVRLEDRYGRKS